MRLHEGFVETDASQYHHCECLTFCVKRIVNKSTPQRGGLGPRACVWLLQLAPCLASGTHTARRQTGLPQMELHLQSGGLGGKCPRRPRPPSPPAIVHNTTKTSGALFLQLPTKVPVVTIPSCGTESGRTLLGCRRRWWRMTSRLTRRITSTSPTSTPLLSLSLPFQSGE